jgi:aminopeptidase N
MWFGDLVTMQWWNGLWLNESFATYMANPALENASDFDNVWDAFYTGNKLGDFVGEPAAASGIDLSHWQLDWLYRSGVTTLQADFTCDASRLTALRLLRMLMVKVHIRRGLRRNAARPMKNSLNKHKQYARK